MKLLNCRSIGCAAALISHLGLCLAAELRVPQARLPLMTTAPTIDGRVNTDEWAGAARMEKFGSGAMLAPQEAGFWVGSDGNELFVAVVSEAPPDGTLVANVQPAPDLPDTQTWLDDSIEIVIDPLRDDTTGRRRLYHVNINSLGAINQSACRVGEEKGERWHGHWRTASRIIDGRWHFEAAIPLSDLGVTKDDLAHPFGIRIGRNWKSDRIGPEQTEWSPLGGSYLDPKTMPIITWDEDAPVVQVLRLFDPGVGTVHFRMSIRNPQSKPIEVQSLVRCIPQSSGPVTKTDALAIPPGGIKGVELYNNIVSEDIFLSTEVKSADGRRIFYGRDCVLRVDRTWKNESPEVGWVPDEKAGNQPVVQFAYYPYADTLKVKVNVSGMEQKEKVRRVDLLVRAQKNGRTVASTSMPPLDRFATAMEWRIPTLSEGEYQLVVALGGTAAEPVRNLFVRHVFGWEHNSLGRSDIVIPPFEPIRVQGRQVSTVSRSHTLNPLCLWDQVESLGKPLLQQPMRLEMRMDGNTFAASARKSRFIEKKSSRVISESRWSAGSLLGTARSEWDYDGMMLWTLKINATKSIVDSLTLVIPLDGRLMPLFHECTDGVRFNYAGLTPPGEGRVWDSSLATHESIVGSYVPYLWLGAEERGFCVFGANDRGWITDPKVPCQELVRRGDILELRLNLIGRPTTIDTARTIIIGFQATPAKPMPPDWRTWVTWLQPLPAVVPRAKITRNIALLPGCRDYGALTEYRDLYPLGEDFGFYGKMVATSRTGAIDQKYLDDWITHVPTLNDGQRALYRYEVYRGFGLLAAKPSDVIAYTDSRGVRLDTPAGQTFLDEWHREAFPSRRWSEPGAGVDYESEPVESFRDYAMPYYKRMYESFLTGVYWDNTYLRANFDTVGSAAYELPAGTIQPDSSLFDMRALFRRAAVLAYELGKHPCNMAHITNASIVPDDSFLQTHLTWEFKAGDTDFQDRFSREYIRAESIGRQSGNVPFCLMLVLGADPAKVDWAERTSAGVLLTHELKLVNWLKGYFWSSYARLLEFGYGTGAVKVYNYWDADYPATIEGSETSSLLLSKAGSALLVVCDYGHGGHLALSLDRQRLGLEGPLRAKDLENGRPLDCVDNGKIMFSLKMHDFKLILVEPKQP